MWRPWYFDQLEDPGGAVWVWSIVQEACGLPDPEEFSSFNATWTPEQVATFTRYVQSAERLAATTVLNAGGTMKSTS
jgi:hypothetical protein